MVEQKKKREGEKKREGNKRKAGGGLETRRGAKRRKRFPRDKIKKPAFVIGSRFAISVVLARNVSMKGGVARIRRRACNCPITWVIGRPASEMLPFSLGHRLAIKPLTWSGTPRKRFGRIQAFYGRQHAASKRNESFSKRETQRRIKILFDKFILYIIESILRLYLLCK